MSDKWYRLNNIVFNKSDVELFSTGTAIHIHKVLGSSRGIDVPTFGRKLKSIEEFLSICTEISEVDAIKLALSKGL